MSKFGQSKTFVHPFLKLTLIWLAVNHAQHLVERLGTLAASSFMEDFRPCWGQENMKTLSDGHVMQLSLDQSSGSGFVSKSQYLYGYFGMQMKLVAGNSAGTVTSFYLSSKINNKHDTHDEIDFEFLGNVSGQPYTLQTNVFAGGEGGREQRIYLWFDPTAAFHWYAITWNRDAVIFWVDSVPIRSFKNNTDLGVPYLSRRPMSLYSTTFDASGWATRGGRVGINWDHSPFVTSYRGFTVMGCKVDNSVSQVDSPDPPCHFDFSFAPPSRGGHMAPGIEKSHPGEQADTYQKTAFKRSGNSTSNYTLPTSESPHQSPALLLQRWADSAAKNVANTSKFATAALDLEYPHTSPSQGFSANLKNITNITSTSNSSGGPVASSSSRRPDHESSEPLVERVHNEIFIYDYCKDKRRYPEQPKECRRNEELFY